MGGTNRIKKLVKYKLASELDSKQHPPWLPLSLFGWEESFLVGGIAVWKSKQTALSSCLDFPMLGCDLELPSLRLLLGRMFYHRNGKETEQTPFSVVGQMSCFKEILGYSPDFTFLCDHRFIVCVHITLTDPSSMMFAFRLILVGVGEEGSS